MLGVSIGMIVVCETSAATPPAENAQWTPPPRRLHVNQPNQTNNKQSTKANAPSKQVQSNSSPSVQSKGQRKNANSRSQVASSQGERRREQAGLITTGVGVVLSAILKPGQTPTPEPVVVGAPSVERKITPRKLAHPRSIDGDVWSRINPIAKDLSE